MKLDRSGVHLTRQPPRNQRYKEPIIKIKTWASDHSNCNAPRP
uniref:Uncharacterized protein n=1 Tax=Anguilla anguilla TaxID=7936 RepID=A0A0E9WHW3_ANGAN